jgi:mono/diheme cytochrome c family protein
MMSFTGKTGSMILLSAALLLVSACGTDAQQGNAENGGKLFGQYTCSACHGMRGEGGRGPKLAGARFSHDQLVAKVRSSNSSIMPSFSKEQISDQDLADIYAFLLTAR